MKQTFRKSARGQIVFAILAQWLADRLRAQKGQVKYQGSGSTDLLFNEGLVLGLNQHFGEYTISVNTSAKSPTLVNAVAGNVLDSVGSHHSSRGRCLRTYNARTAWDDGLLPEARPGSENCAPVFFEKHLQEFQCRNSSKAFSAF
jgi:hypothetical protein